MDETASQVKKTTRRKRSTDVKLSEKDQKFFDENKDTMSDERKDEWLKRRAREDREAQSHNVETDRWFVVKGNKLILKVKKKSGGCYSFYRGNVKKRPELLNDPEVERLLRKE